MACAYERCVEARVSLKLDFDNWGWPVKGKAAARKALENARKEAEKKLNEGQGLRCPDPACRCVLGKPVETPWLRGPTVVARFELDGEPVRAAAYTYQKIVTREGVCVDPDKEIVVDGEPPPNPLEGIIGGFEGMEIEIEGKKKNR